jgi:hypothetical protein
VLHWVAALLQNRLHPTIELVELGEQFILLGVDFRQELRGRDRGKLEVFVHEGESRREGHSTNDINFIGGRRGQVRSNVPRFQLGKARQRDRSQQSQRRYSLPRLTDRIAGELLNARSAD